MKLLYMDNEIPTLICRTTGQKSKGNAILNVSKQSHILKLCCMLGSKMFDKYLLLNHCKLWVYFLTITNDCQYLVQPVSSSVAGWWPAACWTHALLASTSTVTSRSPGSCLATSAVSCPHTHSAAGSAPGSCSELVSTLWKASEPETCVMVDQSHLKHVS